MSLEECPSTLSLTPKPVNRLAGEAALVRDAQSMLDHSNSWKKQKRRKEGVEIRSNRYIDEGKIVTWFCRTTRHRREEASFDDLWVDFQEFRFAQPNAQSAGSRVQESSQLRYISEHESVWSMLLSYPSPMSPRIFTDHVVTNFNDFPSRRRTGLRISTPVNLGKVEGAIEVEGRGIRARHVRIEQIQELEDGYVEWKLLLCEDIGGSFASWCRNRRTKMMLTRDCQAFVGGLKSKQDAKTKKEGT